MPETDATPEPIDWAGQLERALHTASDRNPAARRDIELPIRSGDGGDT